MNNLDLYPILEKACLAAAKIQLENYDKKIEVSSKEIEKDFVTEVDIKSQEAIIKSLLFSMQESGFRKEEIGFISEEGINIQAQNLFVVDPLDGTSNYIEKTGQFCISIAYLEGGNPIAGIVCQPTERIFYFAQKNKGAFKIHNGIKTELKVKNVPMSQAIGAFNSSLWPDALEKITWAVSKIGKKIRSISKSRSAILTALTVATNKNNVFINSKTKVWDITAAKLIIEEAGGVMMDWRGKEIIIDTHDVKKSYEIVACHRELIDEIINELKIKFLLIGSITNSEAKYPEGIRKRFGGGIMYGGKAAASLDIETTVITIGAEDIESGIEELRKLGIDVKRIERPASNNFSNDYSKAERRLYVRSFIDMPLSKDEIDIDISSIDAVILFPLLNEISPSVCDLFKEIPIMLDPQGFTRELGEKTDQGLYPIIQSNWKNMNDFANKITILKMSNDDLSGIEIDSAKSEEEKAQSLADNGFPVAILTRGLKPTIIARKGKDLEYIQIYEAQNPDGLSPAGAGEVFAVAFMFKYSKTQDVVSSVKFANACASLSVSGVKVSEGAANKLIQPET